MQPSNAQVLLLLLCCAGCLHRAVDNPNVIVVAITSGPNNLDPRVGTDDVSQKIHQLIFNDLMDLGSDLRVGPGLAERLDNPDPTTYIATLRQGVKFHDGLELEKGTVDIVINDVGPDIVHQLAASDHLAVTTAPGTDYQYIGLNLRDRVLKDVRVRQALAYAIDRQADVLGGNFQMYALQWVGGAVADPDILRQVFHSSQIPPRGFNRGFFEHPGLDALLDAASVETDTARRLALFGDVQRILADQVPYISLWTKTNVVVSQRSIAGVRLSPFADFFFLKDVGRSTPAATN